MKKLTAILTVLLALAMVFCLAACNGAEETPKDTDSTGPSQSGDSKPQDSKPEDSNPEDSNPEDTVPDETNPPNALAFTHTITVVDSEGNPVAGAIVQYCNDELCFVPELTNEEGIASFNITGAVTKAQFNSAEGYTLVGENVVYLEDGQTNVTFTVTKNI